MSLTVGSLFSGVGGLDLGLERAGLRVLWQAEAEFHDGKLLPRQANAELLAKRFPGTPNYGDVRTVDGRDVPRVDVLCGGFPCQDLSVAGGRAGLAGERSGLFHQFMRLASEVAPTWVLIENVPGLLSSNDGRDMGVVLGVLADLGYGWAYRVLDAQYFGVAQRRRRVFIVGCLGDAARAAAVLLEPESCDGDSAPSRTTGEGVAGTLAPGTHGRGTNGYPGEVNHLVSHSTGAGWWTEGFGTLRAQGGGTDQGGHLVVPDVAPTLQAGGNETGGTRPPGTTVDTCTSLIPTTARYERIDGETETFLPIAFYPHAGREFNGYDDVSPTITVGTGIGIPSPPGVAYPIAVRGRDEGQEWELGKEPGDGGSSRANWALTPAMAFSENQRAEVLETDYARQITTGGGKPGQGYPAVRQGMAVRRLTPRECERLQGFPDGWTEGFPDSTRYRMLGNAVCVPVAAWIGRRMVAA